MAKLNFDASQIAPQQPMEALPAGWYKAAVTESTLEPTNDGTGMVLKTVYDVLEGAFKGRKIFNNFNLQNKNPQAVEIAQQELSGLCHATGVIRCTDSEMLHNIPFFVKLKIEAERTEDSLKNTINPATKQPYKPGDTGTKTYEAKNRPAGYKSINDVPATYAAGGAAAPVTTSAPAPAWATAKAPVVPAEKPAAETPLPWDAKPAAPVEKPAEPAPAKEAKPKGPKGPKKAKEAAPVVEPKYYVYLSDENMPVKSLSEIKKDLDAGMPGDTQVLPEGEIKSDDPQWKDASSLFVEAAPAKAAAPANDVPPWERR